jgi:hypothetical protein
MRDARDVIARAMAVRKLTAHIGDHVIMELEREGYMIIARDPDGLTGPVTADSFINFNADGDAI